MHLKLVPIGVRKLLRSCREISRKEHRMKIKLREKGINTTGSIKDGRGGR